MEAAPQKDRRGRLSSLLWRWNNLDLPAWLVDAPRYMRPIRYRRCTEADHGACLALHQDNEGEFVPIGYEENFKTWLTGEGTLVLVGELEGRIVCCCGISYYPTNPLAVLSFGLVAPEFHRQGIGTTQYITRLALLDETLEGCWIFATVTEFSESFYRRLGMKPATYHYHDEKGNRMRSMIHPAMARELRYCRVLVRESGVVLPEDRTIPPWVEKKHTSEEADEKPPVILPQYRLDFEPRFWTACLVGFLLFAVESATGNWDAHFPSLQSKLFYAGAASMILAGIACVVGQLLKIPPVLRIWHRSALPPVALIAVGVVTAFWTSFAGRNSETYHDPIYATVIYAAFTIVLLCVMYFPRRKQ